MGNLKFRIDNKMTINSIEKKTNSRSPMKSETVSESEGVEMKLEANRLKDKK